METLISKRTPQRYRWEPMILSPQTVKGICVGYLIRTAQQNSNAGHPWSSYSVITDIYESGYVRTFSKLIEVGQLVQVAHPHYRPK